MSPAFILLVTHNSILHSVILSFTHNPMSGSRFLVKRSQGRHKGQRPKNFKKRYFVLTAKGLTYAKGRGDSPLCTIPASNLLAVERVDDQTFNMKFVRADHLSLHSQCLHPSCFHSVMFP